MRQEHGRSHLAPPRINAPRRHRSRSPRRAWWVDAVALVVAALAVASPASAQEVPAALAAPPDDPRKGPRLEYSRGPAQCLDERGFRSEVAIPLDGVDHLAADSPDVARVWFEAIPDGYKGTLVYTDAQGNAHPPVVRTYSNCETLGRWLGWAVSRLVPREPDPPAATPCSACPVQPCPRSSCPACPVCGTSRPVTLLLPRSPSWRMDLTVGLSTYVMMTSFLSADVGPAVGVAGSVGGEIFSVNTELRFVLPSRAYARERIPGATSSYPQEFDLSQLTALLVPCGRWKYLVACGVAQLGALILQSPNHLGSQISYGFGPRLGFEVPFAERFSAFGFAEVLFAPSPAAVGFTLPDPEHPDEPPANTQWQQSVASGFFGAGVSVKFM